MKNLLLLFFMTAFFISCDSDKEFEDIGDASECSLKMREYYKGQLYCNKNPHFGTISTNLIKGNYKGKIVYYINVECENCLVAAPSSGYTCELELVDFSKDFENVKDIKMVYNSCEKKFYE